MTIKPEVQEWIHSADRDRDSVFILLDSSRVPFEIVAFHCQQCAEKYLKAMYIHSNRKMPFIHDLLKLNRDIQDVCTQLQEVEEECEKLTPFGTVTRYPGSTMQPEAGHMPHVTKWMDAVRDRVRDCLNID